MWEFREVGKFRMLAGSGNQGGWNGSKDYEGGRIGSIISSVRNGFLQLLAHFVSYQSGDYRTERLVDSTSCPPCCSCTY
jgi:hypothetical protein